MPMTRLTQVATNPTIREMRPPTSVRTNRSRPRSSVPKKWAPSEVGGTENVIPVQVVECHWRQRRTEGAQDGDYGQYYRGGHCSLVAPKSPPGIAPQSPAGGRLPFAAPRRFFALSPCLRILAAVQSRCRTLGSKKP